MPDREKVIKTLTDALTVKENYPWAKAEMSFEFIKMLLELLKEQEYKDKMFHALEDDWKRLRELLEEQEAVEPRRDANCVRMFRCGVCSEYVGFIDSDTGDHNEQDNYCRNCGRKVKWE